MLPQDAQSAESRFAWIVQLTKTITNVPFAWTHRLCNQFTILSTTYTDPIIDNHQGCVEITPGSALFLPAAPESHMTVLREDWKKFLQGRPGDAFSPCIRNRCSLT